MSYYGGTVTKAGRELMAKLYEEGKAPVFTRTMVGSGKCPDETYPGDLTELVQPVAAATTGPITREGNTVYMTVEYRSDLNGGLDHDFAINEFGVFLQDPSGDSDVLLYYGCLGDYPEPVRAYDGGKIDVRRYPISITFLEGQEPEADFPPQAFMTADDVMEFCTTSVLPRLIEEAGKLIEQHNADPGAHPALQNTMSAMDGRIALLELMYGTDVSGNPFNVTFENLNSVSVTGIWNQTKARVEF